MNIYNNIYISLIYTKAINEKTKLFVLKTEKI